MTQCNGLASLIVSNLVNNGMSLKILAISDVELPKMRNTDYLLREYSDVDLLVSCGDMSIGYLDFIGSVLTLPLFFVRGNHDTRYEPRYPGGDDLHLRFRTFKEVSFAGLEGSIRYNRGAVQYTESEMFLKVMGLMPRMLLNRARQGFGVHVMVTHSPPRNIHDIPEDYAHRGFRSFRWLMFWGQPQYLIHGHVDTWDRRKQRETVFAKTTVLNINPYMVLEL